MKSSAKISLILLGLTILLIALIDLASDKPVDWNRTFDQRDKIPYGLYVTRNELPNIIQRKDITIKDFTQTNYTFLRDFLKGKENASIAYVVDNLYEGKEVVKELISYVDRGGEVFISTNSFPIDFLDTLGIRQDYYYPQDFTDAIDVKKRPFMLNDGTMAFYKDLDYPGLFTKLDSADAHIIGYFEAEDKEIPNFIEVKRKKGRFILHLEPMMFTNYYMLQERNFRYGAAALNFLSRKNIYWYDAKFNAQKAHTPLRVLLQNQGLRQSWYILLFGLILFLLFRSKREQKAVAVVTPEPNLSREFAKTIASLYYENGNPANLAQKKVEYFLYEIRTHSQLDILKLDDEDFASQLAAKSGVPLTNCQQIVRLLLDYRHSQYSNDKELVELNKEIEAFKQKANML